MFRINASQPRNATDCSPRVEIAESKIAKDLQQPLGVFTGWSNEEINVTCQSGVSVEGHCVSANDEILNLP